MLFGNLAAGLIQRRIDVPVAGSIEIRPDEQQVFVDGGRAVLGHFQRDRAFLAEAGIDLARARVQRGHLVA